MTEPVRVLVHGTGFAGQGHAEAFRAVGADIVGIVGRTPHVTEQVAANLSIPYFGTDWAVALETCNPDVVSIGTPGGVHFGAIKLALESGCHVFCDKPLSVDGVRARELYDLAVDKKPQNGLRCEF